MRVLVNQKLKNQVDGFEMFRKIVFHKIKHIYGIEHFQIHKVKDFKNLNYFEIIG